MGQAVVVGGGIGGLSAAIGLSRAGWTVEVLERSPVAGEVGAGLTLWPNALRALRALGLADQVAELSAPQRRGGVRRPDGAWLSRWAGPVIEERLGDPMIGIHRAKLHEMLRAALPAGALRLGTDATVAATVEATVHTRPPDLAGAADLTGAADLIVAADGIDSRFRRALWPDHPAPAYSGVTAWRGVCAPGREVDVAITWGRGREAGVVPLADGRVYWYFAMNAAAGYRPNDEKGFVLGQVGAWHDPIPALVEATPADAVLHHDIYHLGRPLPSYVSGRVVLLGDAAHAMTPNLGQGGCQAIEDAAVLMAAAGRHGNDVPAILAEYDAGRRPRTQAVARLSARVGRFTSGISNPFLAALRDIAVRLTPAGLSLRGMTSVADWTPPDGGVRPAPRGPLRRPAGRCRPR